MEQNENPGAQDTVDLSQMPDDIRELCAWLQPAEMRAVYLLTHALNAFNSYDGTGLLAGPERFRVLEDRVRIAAVQAQTSLRSWWDRLAYHMRWPAPPQFRAILRLCARGGDVEVLTALRRDAQSLVMLARVLHDEGKRQRKAQEKSKE